MAKKAEKFYRVEGREWGERALITFLGEYFRYRLKAYPWEAETVQQVCTLIEVALDEYDTKQAGAPRYTYRLLRHRTDSLANWQSRDTALQYYTNEAAIVEAEKLVLKLIKERDAAIKAAHKSWQYQLLAAKAFELGWPTSYQADLTFHDALVIARSNPQEFLWRINAAGTHVVLSNDPVVRRTYTSFTDSRFYLVKDHQLTEFSAQKFLSYQLPKLATT